MFGRGQTVLQPVYVEDVAEAIVRAFDAPEPEMVYEIAGPKVYSYKELLQTLTEHLGIRRRLVPVPFGAWQSFALVAELLPAPPITRNQVELMAIDNVASLNFRGFEVFSIEPRGIEVVLGGRVDQRSSAKFAS
jgi:uncharacterized protein YbjT (DUF2867 family)